MGNALKEAKAAIASIEAKAKELRAQIAEATKGRAPLEAKVLAIRKRRMKVPVIKNLAGAYLVGSLGELNAEIRYVFKDGAKPTPKAVRDGLENGSIKIAAGGYGQSYSLKGLLPRLRLIDKPTYAAYRKRVMARQRLERLLSEARAAEAIAFDATYKAGAKPDAEMVIAGIIDQAIAVWRLEQAPIPHQVKHDLERLIADDMYSPLGVATQHLKHLQSGSSEPCPCRNCASDRQRAIQVRDEIARRATLSTRMVACSQHGRKRMPVETKNVHPNNVPGLAEKLPENLRYRWLDIEIAYCPDKRHGVLSGGIVLVTEYLAALEKAAAKAAKPTRLRKGPAEGDTIDFTCPNCGSTPERGDVYLDDEGDDLRVMCGNCQAEVLASAVVILKPKVAKAA